ncbi:MAG: phosphoglycerate mutase family protein [Sandaracinus sp.]
MPVLLVRHGEAVGSQGDDAHRYLTYKGRSDTLKVGRALKDRSITASQILASPLVRAVQTAEILAHVLGFDGMIVTDPAFVPDGDPVLAARRMPVSTGTTIVVCHEPIVRGIAAHLTGQPQFPGFRTSGCVLLEGTRVTLALHPDNV